MTSILVSDREPSNYLFKRLKIYIQYVVPGTRSQASLVDYTSYIGLDRLYTTYGFFIPPGLPQGSYDTHTFNA